MMNLLVFSWLTGGVRHAPLSSSWLRTEGGNRGSMQSFALQGPQRNSDCPTWSQEHQLWPFWTTSLCRGRPKQGSGRLLSIPYKTTFWEALALFLSVTFLNWCHRHYFTLSVFLGYRRHHILLILGGKKKEARASSPSWYGPWEFSSDSCLILNYECGPQMWLWNAT